MEEFLASPIPETALLFGGFLAIIIGVVGRSEKTHVDEVAIVLAFLVGIFMIALAVLEVAYGDIPISTTLVLGILGLCLFSRAFKMIKWAFLISVILAAALSIILHILANEFSINSLSTSVILVIGLILFIILFLVLKSMEVAGRFLAATVSFRPIMFVGGLLALGEAILLFMGTSISGLFG